MVTVSPPMAFWMGGEEWNDSLVMVTGLFGGSAVDDGNWPGSDGPSDDDSDSVECVPPTHMFMADGDRPTGFGDYPTRRCTATGALGAAHAMVQVDGRWYLRDYAPASRYERRF